MYLYSWKYVYPGLPDLNYSYNKQKKLNFVKFKKLLTQFSSTQQPFPKKKGNTHMSGRKKIFKNQKTIYKCKKSMYIYIYRNCRKKNLRQFYKKVWHSKIKWKKFERDTCKKYIEKISREFWMLILTFKSSCTSSREKVAEKFGKKDKKCSHQKFMYSLSKKSFWCVFLVGLYKKLTTIKIGIKKRLIFRRCVSGIYWLAIYFYLDV